MTYKLPHALIVRMLHNKSVVGGKLFQSDGETLTESVGMTSPSLQGDLKGVVYRIGKELVVHRH